MLPPSLSRAGLLALAGAAALLTLAGCQDKTAVDFRHDRDGKGTKIATFHDDAITAEELKERFAEMSPFARAGYEPIEKRKEYVEGLARFELLAAEALARGLHNDPEVVETAKKVMVQKLIQQEFDEKPTPVSDAEVAGYYEKHKADYVKPEMIRLSYLFVSAGRDDAERAQKRAKAQEILAKAKALPPHDQASFGKLVVENSEHEKTKALRGDLRFLSREELEAQYGKPLADAAKELVQLGQLSDVIETPEGFHILKLQGHQPAMDRSVAQVKTDIQRKLLFEKRTANFNTFVEGLKARAKYALDEKALAGVEIDLKAPPKDTRRPAPGYIPPVAGPPIQ